MTMKNENENATMNDNLNIVPEDDNMQADTGTETCAGASAPEDTQTGNPYQSTIEQQNSTIQALMEQNERLTVQINKLIRNGAAIVDDPLPGNPTMPDNPDITANDDYIPLKDLGSEFGRR